MDRERDSVVVSEQIADVVAVAAEVYVGHALIRKFD
jgi:hypothetical protein